ncbi:MAG: hypothetical protein JXD23_07930 [Spirochaetales bacterium]|nr:hypothetical protein [Spirochaetales bacterium]
MVEIGFHDLGVTKADLEIRLGYEAGRAPEPFGGMIDEVLAEAPGRLGIQAGYRLVPLSRPADKRDGLLIGGPFFRTGTIVAGEFARADEAAVFACTIGPSLETWASDLTGDGEPALGFVVDSAASEFAERTAAVLHDGVAAFMRERGRGVTNRYSPGYCTWDVGEQRTLFSLLPDGFCGIRLTESALMVPVKSVSGIIGTGKSVERRDYRCDRCGVEECVWRAVRTKKKSETTDKRG